MALIGDHRLTSCDRRGVPCTLRGAAQWKWKSNIDCGVERRRKGLTKKAKREALFSQVRRAGVEGRHDGRPVEEGGGGAGVG